LNRCDGRPQCSDKSDEIDCEIILIDEAYYKEILPPGKDGADITYVNVSFSVLTVLKISEVDDLFYIKFRLISEWNDPRLSYKNVKEVSTKNVISDVQRGQIWVPEMVFSNTEEDLNTILDDKAIINIIRNKENLFKISKKDDIENYQIFSGDENTLSLSRVYNVKFICIYGVMFYPFDSQVCYADIILKGNVEDFMKIVPDRMDFPGKQELSQYFIRGYNHCPKVISGKEGIRVEIFLSRRLLGTALTIYLPTILMNIIGHNANYFKAFFFEAVISVNLTVMLVLATMFVSVSESLPKTSYIKMIDVWLLFNLIIPFVEVLMHTYMDLQRDEEAEDGEGVEDEGRVINHHGKPMKVGPEPTDPKLISVSPRDGYDRTLVARKENVQVDALRDYYNSEKITRTVSKKRNLARAQKATLRIIPLIAILFIGAYWLVGYIIHLFPMQLGVIDPVCDL